MNNPKVSIIVPIYNSEKYLDQCLNSLINQTLKQIEIICVNDGSNDNSSIILNEFSKKDSRILVLNKENQGQSSARNLGLKYAKGEYIGFLDSDDYVQADMYEKLYKQAISNFSDIVMCSITTLNEKTQELNSFDPYLNLNIFPKKLESKAFHYSSCKDFLFRICVVPWNKIYKSSFLKEKNIKFVQNLSFEDNLFCLETLIKSSKISILKESLVIYRLYSDNSITFGSNDEKKLDYFEILDLQKKLLINENIYKEYKKAFEFHKKTTLLYWYKKIKNKKIKKIYFKKLFKIYPLIIFENLKKYIKNKVKLLKFKKIIKNNKVVIFETSNLSAELLKNIRSKNILGVLDFNPKLENKDYCDYKIISPKELLNLNPEIIVGMTENYYNYKKIIETKLNEENISIKIVVI